MPEDEQDLQEYDQDEFVEFDARERRLVTQSYDLSVNTLVEQWDDKTLILPSIQREYVWDNAKASRLIESLLLNVPIPVVYFAEAPEDKYEVIDGHQRVRSIVRFINNEFRLVGLKVLADREHKGKRFHQLPVSEQRRIKTRVIRAIIITDESHPSMKFEVFERLNTGSIALNAQEIRNSTHRGPFNDLIKQLVDTRTFRLCIGTKYPRKRMVDHELVLRFFAIFEDREKYRPPLARFLNNYLERKNRSDPMDLGAARTLFEKASGNVHGLFGSGSFRLTDERGHLLDRNVNRALAETQLVSLAQVDGTWLSNAGQLLLMRLGELHRAEEFLDDIQRATGDRARTLDRIASYEQVLREAGAIYSSP